MKEESLIEKQIRELEEEISKTKYNKHTQFHIGKLKAKIATLKDKQEKAKSSGPRRYGYCLKKSGDATVIMVGFPSVGKSTLLNILTNAESKIGSYNFTTIDVVPGVLLYNSAQIQILDLPGLIAGASSGAGRGKEVLSVARIADLVLIMITSENAEKEVGIIKKELYDANFRLDVNPPDIKFSKKYTGGISVGSTVKLTRIDEKTIKAMLNELGYHNADVVIRENCDVDRFLDAVRSNRIFVPSQIVITKSDLIDDSRRRELKKKFPGCVLLSSIEKEGIDELKEKIWEKTGLIRIYMKPVNKEVDMKEPLIMRKGDSVSDVMVRVHKKMLKYFKYSRVWGKSAKFPGQKLGLDHKLKDGDIVELHF